jgi:hypothetical protein
MEGGLQVKEKMTASNLLEFKQQSARHNLHDFPTQLPDKWRKADE